jgi:SAM-dependent methyltransferase
MKDLSLHSGERQVAETVDEIRRDHVARYEWARDRIMPDDVVVDLGCGVGYGSNILAEKAAFVVGLDESDEAIGFAKAHYARLNIDFKNSAAYSVNDFYATCAVAFEVLEHMDEPAVWLRMLTCSVLLASVPNEEVFPWNPSIAFHKRHYTREQFEDLLNDCGWEVDEWWGQQGINSEVERDVNGNTIVVQCVRSKDPIKSAPKPYKWKHPTNKIPETVMLVGLGPSKLQFIESMLPHDFRPSWGELWTINKGIDLFPQADIAWVMDDIQDHAFRWPNYGHALNKFKGAIISQSLPPNGIENIFEYPLLEVLKFYHGRPYDFMHTISVPYILAYAGYIGVKRIILAGIDCHWPDNARLTEAGQSVVCYWIGRLEALGVQVDIVSSSALNDTHRQASYGFARFYGYLRQPVLET